MRSDKTILVWDHRGGSYLNVAQCLSPYFKKTYYHSECRNAFPHPSDYSIGTGFEEFCRIDDVWRNLDLFDVIIFPDGGFTDIGSYLRTQGKLVFGGSNMYNIEESRSQFNNLLERAGLPIAPSIVVNGLKNLTKILKTKKDKWIKVSKWRNLVETYHWVDYQSSKFWLDELTHKLGPLAESEIIEFIIQDPIDAIAETGCDGYTLNGQLPQSLIIGIECKDAGYVGKVTNDVPGPIHTVNEKFSPILSAFKSNGFYSTEIRYTAQGEAFYTDIAARAGMPPSSSYLSNINNWDQIIPSIAVGTWVEPEYKSIYMVELILKSNYCKDGYLPVTFPDEFKEFITFKGAMKVDGQIFIIPFSNSNIDMVEFGSVVINDDNLDAAIAKALDIASQIKCYELRYEVSVADIIKEEIDNLSDKLNIKF